MTFIKTHQPCPCGESSDAYSINEDGSGKCFSCGKTYGGSFRSPSFVEGITVTDNTLQEAKSLPLQPWRNLTTKTMAAYDVKAYELNEKFLAMPVPNGRVLCRSLETKKFWFVGSKAPDATQHLFGQDKFSPNSAKAITVTEGFLDAMAVYQMNGQHPVVAVQSASSAKTEVSSAWEYLNSFDKIYLCFDNDTAGKKATAEVSRLFDFNKVYVVPLNRNDPMEYLEAQDSEGFRKVWWNSKRIVPEGILSTFSEFDAAIDNDRERPSVEYPFAQLQEMTYGARDGEYVLFTALEGIGKTEIFRAMEHHFLKTTDDNIGIIHLEEDQARTVKGVVSYELQTPAHLPETAPSKEDMKKAFRSAVKRDERLHIYSHFGSDDPDVILSTVRFLAGACNCKRIFLDHISMVVSGLQGEDERKALDYISTQLKMMTKELGFTLFVISHVNDEGLTRGSRNISKVADLRVDLHRDLTAVNENLRNTTELIVTKNRFAGKTGPAGKLFFNTQTFCLEEQTDDDMPF